jgi:hypothetical protein
MVDERRVLFFDQLGCDLLERPHGFTLWTVERFREELASTACGSMSCHTSTKSGSRIG